MRSAWIGTCVVVLACAPEGVSPPLGHDGVAVSMDVTGAGQGGMAFFDAPYPSDLRLSAAGAPPLADLPGLGRQALFDDLAATVADRRGYSVLSVAWFRFDGAVAPQQDDVVVPAAAGSPLMLVDVDPDSPFRGTLVPVVAATLEPDPWLARHVLAVSPRPGFILREDTTYAYVVRRSLGDADGALLGTPVVVSQLLRGEVPDTPWGQAAEAEARLVRDTLAGLDVDVEDVAAFTVFTTGDAVAETYAMSEQVRADHHPAISDLAPAGERGTTWPTYCELHGTMDVPEFQVGTPPYNTGGTFAVDDAGQLVAQRTVTIPVVVNVPREPMPEAGYPLGLYFHGSGGLSDQLVLRGPRPEGGEVQEGYGPAHVLALHGIASAGSAHPVNPERLPGASSTAYLNFQNFSAFRDTFRQGILEQRLYLDALLELEIPPSVLADCEGVALPEGAVAYRFDPDGVVAMGQSMGGMYTNLIGAVEPRIRAVVPTGAGGHWSRFILVTSLLGEGLPESLLQVLLDTDQPLTFLHPAMHLAQAAWEPSEPMVSTPRLAQRPLPGHPVRPLYAPAGLDDSYFPPVVYDAMALSYGATQGGEPVWPGMQEALASDGRDGLESYPISANRTSDDGVPYTGVIVQSAGDGFSDPHVIFTQLDDIKHQYGCFFATFLDDGVGTVPGPGALGDPCVP